MVDKSGIGGGVGTRPECPPATRAGNLGGLTVSNGTPGPIVVVGRGFDERAGDGAGDEIVGTTDGELVLATARGVAERARGVWVLTRAAFGATDQMMTKSATAAAIQLIVFLRFNRVRPVRSPSGRTKRSKRDRWTRWRRRSAAASASEGNRSVVPV